MAEPLLIVHQPIAAANAGTSVTVNAMIKHISGIASAKVFWRQTATTEFVESGMSLANGDNWTASIPIAMQGVDVEYYIWAQANSGKSLTRPITAPTGFWTINVESLSVQDWARTHIAGPYPNPATRNVNFNFGQIGQIEVTVTNALGQILLKQSVNDADGLFTLDLQADWKGTLFVTFKGDFGQITRKVVKL